MSGLPFANVNAIINKSLGNIYHKDECIHIAKSIFSKITRQNYVEINRLNTKYKIEEQDITLLESYVKKLRNYMPLQYVLGEAYFDEHVFYVNENVLIPRQETNNLVTLASEYIASSDKTLHCIDLCTGSGCIAISLQKRHPSTYISAIDISDKALVVAKENAKRLNCQHIAWHHVGIEQFMPDQKFDVIVSNPPYISSEEYKNLDIQVKQEPKIALLEPQENPLYFYNLIARWASQYLNSNGRIILEINESKGEEVISIFNDMLVFNNIKIQQDFLGKNRFITANRNSNL